MDERQKKVLSIIMAAVLLISMYFVARESAAYVNSDNVASKKQRETKYCVVIDPGHGGA